MQFANKELQNWLCIMTFAWLVFRLVYQHQLLNSNLDNFPSYIFKSRLILGYRGHNFQGYRQPQIRSYFRHFANSKQRRAWGYEICFVCECCADEISWAEKISWDFIGATFTNKTNLVTSRILYIEKYWASQFFWNPIFVAKYIVV